MGLFDFIKKKESNSFGSLDSDKANTNSFSSGSNFGSSSNPFSSQADSNLNSNDSFAQHNNLSENNSPNSANFDSNAHNSLYPQSDFESGNYPQQTQNFNDSLKNDYDDDIPSFPQQQPLNRNMNSGNIQSNDVMSSKNMEIVLSKLDAIRLAIQNIDHRMSVIESRLGIGNKNNHRSDGTNSYDEDNIF